MSGINLHGMDGEEIAIRAAGFVQVKNPDGTLSTVRIGSAVQGSANNLSSSPVATSITSQIIDAISEGPIEGWPTSDPFKHIYLDGTPVKSYNSTINTDRLRYEFRPGTSNQYVLSNYTIIGSVKQPTYSDEIIDIADTPRSGTPIVQQVQIRDDTDGAYPTVEAIAFTFTFPEGLFRVKGSGGRESTTANIKIEVNRKSDTSTPEASALWASVVNDYWEQEITSGSFDVTYIVELPPGWGVPKNIQKYTEANKVDDVISFRISKEKSDWDNTDAYSKLYLKAYAVYSRNRFSYPYTSLVGLTIDSKNFDGSIPRRQYDLKLLKVRVPSNYYIETDPATGEVTERRYEGIWDGQFKKQADGQNDLLVWTDNPVWCFYDLITNPRYGLGEYIDSEYVDSNSSLLNKWKLYEIAKYCDAVEQDGANYIFSIAQNKGGVVAANGGSVKKEPRFTCNLLIKDREEAYSVIQRMASLFRGIAFFQHGGIQLIQDKPSTPLFLYNNTNVVDGVFSYSSSSAKARHTVALVKWLDPSDLYSEKIEYVEDYDGIARYGYREIEIDGFGCTSRGQARRIGRHILITEKFELETVTFKVGIEGNIVTPGSIIKIKDSNRQLKRAGGRIVSANSTTITLDKAVDIPAGATSITLWVEVPTASTETIETVDQSTYRPTLISYTITAIAGTSNLSTLTIVNPSTFSTVPTSGNLWVLSYIPAGSTENTSLYKVLSVVENDSYEHEITALQHYSDKYEAIEAYAPIPQYAPVQFSAYIAPPDRGWISTSYNTNFSGYDISIAWDSDNYVSGTKYRLSLVINNSKEVVLLNNTTDTTFIYKNADSGFYTFKVYSLGTISNLVSEALVIGPYYVTEVLPKNNFSSFSQSSFSSNAITHTWPDDKFPNEPLSYEIWKSTTDSLRTFVSSKVISKIVDTTNTITLTDFDSSTITQSPEKYRVEADILPYTRYNLTDVNNYGITATNSSTLVVLNTYDKPDVSVGDIVTNLTLDLSSNVIAVQSDKVGSGPWYTRITISPAITGQTATNIVYFRKGIIGVRLNVNKTNRSGAIKQTTFTASTSTNTTNIYAPTGTFTNLLAGDIVVNKTRGIARVVTSKTSNQQVVVPTITGQVAGDTIAFYQSVNRDFRALKSFITSGTRAFWAGEQIIIKDFNDVSYFPENRKTFIVNLTRGKCAQIVDAKRLENSTTAVEITYLPPIAGAQDNDEVIFINNDEVFSAALNTHIHPTTATATTGTDTNTIVTTTSVFPLSAVGNIVVNATRNKAAIIDQYVSGTQVHYIGNRNNPDLADFSIANQASGDIIFIISGDDIKNTYTKESYNHPSIYTTIATTNSTTVTATGAFTGVTTSHKLYNATRKAYASISNVGSANTITLTAPGIVGQLPGDKIYTFLPAEVSTTTVTAVDGAFNYASEGDIFKNVTRNKISTIKSVITLTGNIDNRIDKLVLSSPIAGQTAGDEFLIYRGTFSATPSSFINNASNDKVVLDKTFGLRKGDRVNIYLMNATKAGSTSDQTFVDSGLEASTTYYYWMRATNVRVPAIVGQWVPTDTTGDSATTLPLEAGNYNSSNDNNGNPISPDTITPVSPFIDLPAGGTNADSTANITLHWEWTGLPNSIDGFAIYFWNSNDTTDDNTIDSDEDYIEASQGFSIPVNPKILINNITYSATTTTTFTVTTATRHNLQPGSKIRIVGAKKGTGTDNMSYINDLHTVSTAPSTVSFTVVVNNVLAPGEVYYTTKKGAVASCRYRYQVNNLTANYYYNAWIQPYRMVNKNISENGIIVGTPVKLYS
jgi:predicted phage tail protein